MLNKKGIELSLRMILLIFIVAIIILILFIAFQKGSIFRIEEIWNEFIFNKIK